MNMYFIALVLPYELNEKVLTYKQTVFEKWGCKVGLKSPAHITITPPFWLEGEKEMQLLQDVNCISKNISAFDIGTNNFSAFKSRTIFIDVLPNEALAQLKKEADTFFKKNNHYKIKIENRSFHPHITIATRDLHKKTFAEAWEVFTQKEFKVEWKSRGLSILKHNGRNWDVIHTSLFNDFEHTL